MKFFSLHRWNLSPKEAIQLQDELAPRLELKNNFGKIRTVAGADVALDTKHNVGFGGVIMYTYPDLRILEKVSASAPLTFPYLPGLLAFREAPVLLQCFRQLKRKPDLILFDGQGIAHPRRMGIASHMGLLLERPTIGCAKSRLIGNYLEPEVKRGSWTPLLDSDKTIGAVLRSRDRVKPIFVSIGYRIDLMTAIEIILRCCDGFRIPKPTREADRLVKKVKTMWITKGACQKGAGI